MRGYVIERRRTTIERERIIPQDLPATWEAADALAGFRLDRRKKYAIISGRLCHLMTWSSTCSRCTEVEDMNYRPDRGEGCGLCGGSGKNRRSVWVPVL